MYGRSTKKLFILVVSCAAIVFGAYMTFFHDNTEDEDNSSTDSIATEQSFEKSVMEETQMFTSEFDYSDKKLPDEENVSADETYNADRVNVEVYFSNTDMLDQGQMPIEAQKVLCNSVQKYLRLNGYEDVTELYIDNDSYEEDTEKITFTCFMDGYQERIQIDYIFADQELKFYIVESIE